MNKRALIEKMIADAQATAIEKEAGERAAGKILNDNPVARLLAPIGAQVARGEGRILDPIKLVGKFCGRFDLSFGETSYLTTRRMWLAWQKAVEIADGDTSLLYDLFHVVPGVASLVERGNTILLGVRSSSLAGTHAGMVSVPAGLMGIGETFLAATLRELDEETSIWRVAIIATAAGDNPDAPNVTFLSRMKTDQEEVSETFEAKGKKFFWMPRTTVFEAVRGNTGPLSEEFGKRGVPLDSCRIAPDILSGMKQLYGL